MQTPPLTYRTVVGRLTAAYGLACATRPATLLGPARMANTRRNRGIARAVGARDILSGLALVLAPADDRALVEAAVTARVVADASDVVVFGVLCPRGAKLKAMAIAAGWGGACSLAHPRLAARLPERVAELTQG